MLERLREFEGADQVEIFAESRIEKTGMQRILDIVVSKTRDLVRAGIRKPDQASA